MDKRPLPPMRPSDDRVHVWPAGYRILRSPYRVVRPLGLGGMGIVYEAEDVRDGSRRAVKALLRKHTNDPDLLRRLEFEVRVMRSFPPHPNLPRVGELFKTPDGTVCFDMDLLTGSSLRDTLRRSLQQFPPDRAALVALDLLAALSVVHRAGYVHRDVKPNNVFLCEDDRAVLLDFGVAKALFDAPGRPFTAKEWFPGTANYMAPEYLDGKSVTPQYDVYAVGLVLWECLSGRAAFARKTFAQTSYAIISKGVPSLKTLGFDWLPHEFMLVVERATARDPRYRYRTADAFADALRRVVPLLSSLPQAPARASVHPALERAIVGGHVITPREVPRPLPEPGGELPGAAGGGPAVPPNARPQAQAGPGDGLPRDEPSVVAGDASGGRSSWHEDQDGRQADELPPSSEQGNATELHPPDEGDATEVRSPAMLDASHDAEGGAERAPHVSAEPRAHASGRPDDSETDDEATSHHAELSAYLSTVDPFGDTDRAGTPDGFEADAVVVSWDVSGLEREPGLEPTLRSNEGVDEAREPEAPPSAPDALGMGPAVNDAAGAGAGGHVAMPLEASSEPAARTTDGPNAHPAVDARASDVTSDRSGISPRDTVNGEEDGESEETDPFGAKWPPYLPARPELMLPPRPTWGLAREARRARGRAALEASSDLAPTGSEQDRLLYLLADMETNLRNTDDEGASEAPAEPSAARRPGRFGQLGGGLAALSRALFGAVRPLGLLVAARAMGLLGAALALAAGRRSNRPPAALPAPASAGKTAASVPVPPAPQTEESEEP